MKSLGQPVETRDALLIHLISTKLDPQSSREWESSIKQDVPELNDMLDFLKNRCRFLESLDNQGASKFNSKFNKDKSLVHVSTDNHANAATYNVDCAFCKQKGHGTYRCQKLLALSYKSRYFELKKAGICTNCLRAGHNSENCNGKTCQICSKRHNSILHDNNFEQRKTQNRVSSISNSKNSTDKQVQESHNVAAVASENNSTVNNATTLQQTNSQVTLASHNLNNNYQNKLQVLLATAIVHVIDQNNKMSCIIRLGKSIKFLYQGII